MVKISCYKGVNENGIYTNTQKVLGLPYGFKKLQIYNCH